MLFVQFIGVTPGSAGGSPRKKFCSGNVNTAKNIGNVSVKQGNLNFKVSK